MFSSEKETMMDFVHIKIIFSVMLIVIIRRLSKSFVWVERKEILVNYIIDSINVMRLTYSF